MLITNYIKSRKFLENIFKKHQWKFMQIMCKLIWHQVIKLLFIMIRLGSLERDY